MNVYSRKYPIIHIHHYKMVPVEKATFDCLRIVSCFCGLQLRICIILQFKFSVYFGLNSRYYGINLQRIITFLNNLTPRQIRNGERGLALELIYVYVYL